MLLIQPILIILILAIGGVYLTLHRSRLVFRLANLTLVGMGVLFVVNPDLSTRLARSIGVGRGTDLLLYALCVATASTFLHLYRKSRALEERLTEAMRHIALQSAKNPSDQR
jgi:hypothetical protein